MEKTKKKVLGQQMQAEIVKGGHDDCCRCLGEALFFFFLRPHSRVNLFMLDPQKIEPTSFTFFLL
jgi:hypothetical protein